MLPLSQVHCTNKWYTIQTWQKSNWHQLLHVVQCIQLLCKCLLYSSSQMLPSKKKHWPLGPGKNLGAGAKIVHKIVNIQSQVPQDSPFYLYPAKQRSFRMMSFYTVYFQQHLDPSFILFKSSMTVKSKSGRTSVPPLGKDMPVFCYIGHIQKDLVLVTPIDNDQNNGYC